MGTARKIVGGITGETAAEAAGQAAGVQAEAQREALAEQRRQFGIQQRQLAPIRALELRGLRRAEELAVPAQQELQQLLGFGGAGEQQAAQEALLESPAQQALRERAARLSTRTASAVGGLGGGRIRQELFQQGRALDLGTIQQRIGQLGALSGRQIGGGATALGAQLGTQQAGQIAQGIAGIGQAQASGILGAAQARQQGLSNLIRLGGAAAGAGAFGGGGGPFGGGGIARPI